MLSGCSRPCASAVRAVRLVNRHITRPSECPKQLLDEICKSQIDSIKGRHGLMSSIVHHEHLGIARPPQHTGGSWTSCRASVKPASADSNASRRSGAEAEAGSLMTLMPDGDGGTFNVQANERARLAYMELDQGELVYSIDQSAPIRSPHPASDI
jgi:hypothetical protein